MLSDTKEKSSRMAQNSRPLSPHLQVYKPQITSMMSIFHRITGIILAGGAMLLVLWLLALARGPEVYEHAQCVATSVIGQVVIFGWVFCFFYHLLNGLRHMVWDTGRGLSIGFASKSAYVILAATVVLSVLVFYYAKQSWVGM